MDNKLIKELCYLNSNSVYGCQNYLNIRKQPNKLYDEITIYYKDGRVFKFLYRNNIKED